MTHRRVLVLAAGALLNCMPVSGARRSPGRTKREANYELLNSEEHIAKFKEKEEEDRNEHRDQTEVVKRMVYKVQPFDIPFMSNSNAAYEIGELVFLSKYFKEEELYKMKEVIVQHEVEIKVAANMNRAIRHYIQYNDGKPNKDPVKYGIDTVGLFKGKRGGWLSFPSSLKCGHHQAVGDNCAWRDIRRVKSIHTACLMNEVDDGLNGTARVFKDVLKQFTIPFLAKEDALTPDSQLALKLFRKAFHECADVWPGRTFLSEVGVPEPVPYTDTLRRCCCYKGPDREAKLLPRWVLDGVCLPNTVPSTVFAGVWSMVRSQDPLPCGEGKATYRVEKGRGRCLTFHGDATSATLKISEADYGNSTGNQTETFEGILPSLVKTKIPLSGKFVCPAKFGLHHKNCDCSWAGEVC